MSLSIHPAFRVSKGADLFDVAEGLRSSLMPYLGDKFRKEAVTLAIREFDSVDEVKSGKTFSQFLRGSNTELSQAIAGDYSEKYDKYDLSPFRDILDFHSIFLQNKVRNEAYVLSSQDMLGKNDESVFLEVEGIESDFSYWDGSDSQLEVMSEEEWLHRRACWKETISYSRGIAQQGLVVKFFETISPYVLLSWKSYEGQAVSMVTELAVEERFRRIVFNTYLENLRKVYPDLDIMETINDSWRFLNPKKEREYDKLPFAKEQKIRLENAILFAEERVTAFPIVF